MPGSTTTTSRSARFTTHPPHAIARAPTDSPGVGDGPCRSTYPLQSRARKRWCVRRLARGLAGFLIESWVGPDLAGNSTGGTMRKLLAVGAGVLALAAPVALSGGT